MFYDPVPVAGKELLAHYMIHRVAPQHEEFKTKLKIRLNINRMLELEGAELIEQYMEEVEVEIKEDPKKEVKKESKKDVKKEAKKLEIKESKEEEVEEKEGKVKEGKMEEETPKKEVKKEEDKKDSNDGMDIENDKTDAKKATDEKKIEEEPPKPKTKKEMKKRTHYTKLKVENLCSHRLPKKDFDVLYEIETSMNNQDRLVVETEFYKNELESRIYDYKDKLGSEWSIYTNNAEAIT